jgi:hypothetical protein
MAGFFCCDSKKKGMYDTYVQFFLLNKNLCTGFSQNTLAEHTSGYIVGKYIIILLVTEWNVSHETKKIHHHKGCGWLAPRRGSKY